MGVGRFGQGGIGRCPALANDLGEAFLEGVAKSEIVQRKHNQGDSGPREHDGYNFQDGLHGDGWIGLNLYFDDAVEQKEADRHEPASDEDEGMALGSGKEHPHVAGVYEPQNTAERKRHTAQYPF